MNIQLFIGGLLALVAAIGQMLGGSKRVMPHVLGASFDAHAKVTVEALWNVFVINLFLMGICLLVLGISPDIIVKPMWLVRFIALHYLTYSFVFFIFGLNSGLEKGVLKLFQWIVFLIIAILAWLGV